MHMLRDDRLAQHAPTQHATSEELQIAGVNFQAFDLGGHEIARKVWGDYFAKCDAVGTSSTAPTETALASLARS